MCGKISEEKPVNKLGSKSRKINEIHDHNSKEKPDSAEERYGTFRMISLKRYLEATPDALLISTQSAYRSALLSFAKAAVQAIPSTSHDLHHSLTGVESRLQEACTYKEVESAKQEVLTRLEQWGSHTKDQLNATAEDVKALLLALATTAESACNHDNESAAKLGEITKSLETIGRMDDLARMRTSIFASVTELTRCVQDITAASAESARAFKKQISEYETKLVESEKLGMRDTLTGIRNRRGMERLLITRLERNSPFSVVLIDIDDFKGVNDTYGHNAGDQLLKDFAVELRAAIRSSDFLGRWGGDEFMLILDCNLDAAQIKISAMNRWIFGEYVVACGSETLRISVSASYGVSQWERGDDLQHLLARADAAMYVNKKRKDRPARHVRPGVAS
jgi:diguanylate cyclase (GGDEF)-like protein